MSRRLLIISALVSTLLLGGCGGASSKTTDSGGSSITASQPVSGSTGTDASTPCPTENTRAFAKTRFVSDIGGSLFLMNRYILRPYRGGMFARGTHGRTLSLVKAGVAVAATVKLLSNAKENAKANPTLCKVLVGPLTALSSSLSGVVDSLRSGALSGDAISGLSGMVGSLQSRITQAGIPVTAQPVPLG